MTMPKGGRGHKAPYETCTVRIPVALRDYVENLANEYRGSVLEGKKFNLPNSESDALSLDESLATARKLLKQKRSVKHIIIKLLQLIYNTTVFEKDLE